MTSSSGRRSGPISSGGAKKRRKRHVPDGPNERFGRCLHCDAKQHAMWCSGPDGERTLCGECFALYYYQTMPLHLYHDGRVSVLAAPRSKPVVKYEFRAIDSGDRYLNPVVTEVAPGVCGEDGEGGEDCGGRVDDSGDLGPLTYRGGEDVREYASEVKSKRAVKVEQNVAEGDGKVEMAGKLNKEEDVLQTGEECAFATPYVKQEMGLVTVQEERERGEGAKANITDVDSSLRQARFKQQPALYTSQFLAAQTAEEKAKESNSVQRRLGRKSDILKRIGARVSVEQEGGYNQTEANGMRWSNATTHNTPQGGFEDSTNAHGALGTNELSAAPLSPQIAHANVQREAERKLTPPKAVRKASRMSNGADSSTRKSRRTRSPAVSKKQSPMNTHSSVEGSFSSREQVNTRRRRRSRDYSSDSNRQRSVRHRQGSGGTTQGYHDAESSQPSTTDVGRDSHAGKEGDDVANGRVSVKASCKSRNGTHLARRYRLDTKVSFSEFQKELMSLFHVRTTCEISYMDDEGDFIAVTSNNELSEMFAVVRRCSISPLRVRVCPLAN